MFDDLRLEAVPIPTSGMFRDTPEVELQLPLARWTALECGVGSLLDGEILRCGACCEVDGLEDVPVQDACRLALEGHPEECEGVSETLDAQPDRAVAHVRVPCLHDRVVVAIDDLVEVARDVVDDLVQRLMVEAPRVHVDELRQCDAGEVADRHLILGGVFDDLSAEVG